MRRAFIALLIVIALPAAALAQQADRPQQVERTRVLDVLSIYRDLNDMCRGFGGEDSHAIRACAVREKVVRLLNGMGWCYGNQNQNAADLQWHKCGGNELF